MSRNDANVQVKSLEAVLQLGYEVAKSEETTIAQLNNRNSAVNGTHSHHPPTRSIAPERSSSIASSNGNIQSNYTSTNSAIKYNNTPASAANRRYKHDPNVTQVVTLDGNGNGNSNNNSPKNKFNPTGKVTPIPTGIINRNSIGKVPGHIPKSDGTAPGHLSGGNGGKFARLRKAPPPKVRIL